MASDQGDQALPDCGDAIDALTFEQILEMDDDEEREFSRSIVFGFFEQADNTFKDIQEALDKQDLNTLSSQGHFLKGSSATLGLTKVKDGCEKIQNYGKMTEANGDPSSKPAPYFVDKIKELLPGLKRDYQDAEKRLKAFYGEGDSKD